MKAPVVNQPESLSLPRRLLPAARAGVAHRSPRGARLRGRLAAAWLLSILAAVTGPLGSCGMAAAGPARLRLGTLAPKDTSFHQALKVMGERWAKAPGGGAELTVYTDGTMGGEADMVRRMRVGQLQMAMLTASGLSEIDPAVGAVQKIPLVYRSLEEEVHVREKLGAMLEQRFTAKGFRLLCWADAGWVRFFSKSPAFVPADFRKLKMFVWAGDKDHIELMQSEGYRPVPLEFTDTLTALQTGLIETVPSTPFYALAGQFYNAAPHAIEMNWAPLVGGVVITKKAWDALPPEAREVMAQAALEAGAEIQRKGRQENDEALAAMQKRGLVFHPLTAGQSALWEKFGEHLQPKVRGKLVPADLFDEVLRLLAQFRAGKPAGS